MWFSCFPCSLFFGRTLTGQALTCMTDELLTIQYLKSRSASKLQGCVMLEHASICMLRHHTKQRPNINVRRSALLLVCVKCLCICWCAPNANHTSKCWQTHCAVTDIVTVISMSAIFRWVLSIKVVTLHFCCKLHLHWAIIFIVWGYLEGL